MKNIIHKLNRFKYDVSRSSDSNYIYRLNSMFGLLSSLEESLDTLHSCMEKGDYSLTEEEDHVKMVNTRVILPLSLLYSLNCKDQCDKKNENRPYKLKK